MHELSPPVNRTESEMVSARKRIEKLKADLKAAKVVRKNRRGMMRMLYHYACFSHLSADRIQQCGQNNFTAPSAL